MRLPLAAGAAAGAAALVLVLAGCTAATPEPTPTDPVPTFTPDTAELEMSAVSYDALLVIHATATAANGSQLALQLQVHPSTRFDDAFNLNVPDIFVKDCPDLVSQKDFSQQGWSFTRSNVDAIPVEGTPDWPGTPVSVKPAGDAGDFVVTRGVLADDPTGAPACHRPTQFSIAGTGGLAVGAAGDADALTAWLGDAYGFWATDPSVTFSDCTIDVIGEVSGDWGTTSDATACAAGSASRL